MNPSRAYGSVCSLSHLVTAVAMAASVGEHEPATPVTILVVDLDEPMASPLPNVRLVGPVEIGYPAAELAELRAIYDPLELCCALKPVLLRHLREHAEVGVYLDGDTAVFGPLEEVDDEVARRDVLLTPHFLAPIPRGSAYLSELHLLRVGVFNAGFIAVGGRSGPFLDWFEARLRWDCLQHQSIGLLHDQRWLDASVAFFDIGVFRHPGYNVGPWNLFERPLSFAADGPADGGAGFRAGDAPLRVFHFSGFDPDDPGELSVRLRRSSAELLTEPVSALCERYGAALREWRARLGPLPSYRYARDSSGRPLPRQLRRTWRAERLKGTELPSPFAPQDREAFTAWRRRRWSTEAALIAHDTVLSVDNNWPEAVSWGRRTFGKTAAKVRARLLDSSELRG